MNDLTWFCEKERILGIDLDGKEVARATWKEEGNLWDIDHTFVDPSLRGGGVAGKMMQEIIAQARQEKMKVYGTCPYADKWILRHKDELQDVICERPDDKGLGCKIPEA